MITLPSALAITLASVTGLPHESTSVTVSTFGNEVGRDFPLPTVFATIPMLCGVQAFADGCGDASDNLVVDVPGAVTTVSETVVASTAPASAPDRPDEHARADTTAGIGWWIQLGAFKQRDGALDFQRRLIDEQPWLAPLLAVFSERGLNKLQAGPYTTREDARSAAERVRTALRLVPTLIEKR